jgi:hypothetical protein
MPPNPQPTPPDSAAPVTLAHGKSLQTQHAAPGVPAVAGGNFSGDVFIIGDIDECHPQPMAVASSVPQATESLPTPQAAPGVAFVQISDLQPDMFMLDLNDIDDLDDFEDMPAPARRPLLAPMTGAGDNRPVSLTPLTEFRGEIEPSPVYFSDQPAGYVFDEKVTDDTRQLWEVLPKEVFWLIMGCDHNTDIVFE